MTAMINATFIHVAVLRYDTVNEKDVHKFWIRCEEDWLRALRCFTIGVTLFMIVLALVVWTNVVIIFTFQCSTLLISLNGSFICFRDGWLSNTRYKISIPAKAYLI